MDSFEAETSTSTAGSSIAATAPYDADRPFSENGSGSDGAPASPPLPPLSAAALALVPPPPTETLPIANISRIMRRSLPDSAKIGKDAKEAVQLVLSEFISFVTSEANERCLADRRKTISGDDLLTAFRLLGLDEYHEVLRIFLTRYRMAQEANPKPKRRRAAGKRKADAEGQDPEQEVGAEEDEDDEEGGAEDDEE
ncbi:transcriptional activator hap3 [Tilletia horrida]|nr:transcriptional activator hap3 [Tilletia horrida]